MEDEWNPSDFGFFYPDMPSSWETDELINRDNSTYCRTAHCFVRCLRLTHGDHGRINPHTLCKNLPSCLLGKAHTWWLEQNPIIQRGLTHCDNVEQWCRLLLGAFELSPDESFAAFDAVRYTVRDTDISKYTSISWHQPLSNREPVGIMGVATSRTTHSPPHPQTQKGSHFARVCRRPAA